MKMKMEGKFVEFDKKKLIRLKEAYNQAIAEGKNVFTFEDGEYLVGYAKYLIEYLEMKIKC